VQDIFKKNENNLGQSFISSGNATKEKKEET